MQTLAGTSTDIAFVILAGDLVIVANMLALVTASAYVAMVQRLTTVSGALSTLNVTSMDTAAVMRTGQE